MGFIKFKNKIYEIEKEDNNCYIFRPSDIELYKDTIGTIPKEKVSKKTDTLEDMCDVFVYEFKGHRDVFKNDGIIANFLKANSSPKDNVYGAIWVEIKRPDGKSFFRLEPIAFFNECKDLILIR